MVADAERLAQVGGFDPAFSIAADWDLWIRLGATGPVGLSREPTVGYTNHPDNMHNDTAGILRERKALARKHEPLLRELRMGLGDELFWQWVASAQAPSRQRRLAARLYLRHQVGRAGGLVRLAQAPVLEDTLLKAEQPAPEWLLEAAARA